MAENSSHKTADTRTGASRDRIPKTEWPGFLKDLLAVIYKDAVARNVVLTPDAAIKETQQFLAKIAEHSGRRAAVRNETREDKVDIVRPRFGSRFGVAVWRAAITSP